MRESNVHPELVYIDADHRYDSVVADLATAAELFPRATIVGDDWNWESVRAAVEAVARAQKLNVEVLGSAWRIRARE